MNPSLNDHNGLSSIGETTFQFDAIPKTPSDFVRKESLAEGHAAFTQIDKAFQRDVPICIANHLDIVGRSETSTIFHRLNSRRFRAHQGHDSKVHQHLRVVHRSTLQEWYLGDEHAALVNP
jgi:hypothetical protein